MHLKVVVFCTLFLSIAKYISVFRTAFERALLSLTNPPMESIISDSSGVGTMCALVSFTGAAIPFVVNELLTVFLIDYY